MRVKMLRNPAADFDCNLHEAETGVVSEATGKALIAAGIAVDLDAPTPQPKPRKPRARPATPAKSESTAPAKLEGDT